MYRHVAGKGLAPAGALRSCEHSLPPEIIKGPYEFNRFFKRLFHLRRKNAVDIIGGESACRNKEKRGRDKREDDKNGHEFGPELMAEDLIASFHVKPEDVFSNKKHQGQERNTIKCEQADQQYTCNDADGRQLDKMEFNNRYYRNEQQKR